MVTFENAKEAKELSNICKHAQLNRWMMADG